MPKSSKEGKVQILEWCTSLSNITLIVDVGAGSGTYHKLLVKKNPIFLTSKWIAIEAWTAYISKFSLEKKYSSVINRDVRTVDFKEIGNIDLTIMGDVLEHMTKDEAIQLVRNVSNATRYAIISIPIIHYPQDAHEGNPFEIHVKDDWSHTEVMETFPNIIETFQGTEIGCYLLKF
jgi:hypothetical protein